jgi:argininosuccinate lyase
VLSGMNTKGTSLSQALSDASFEVLGSRLHYSDAHLEEILSARHFVEVRTTPGGPAPSETTGAIDESRHMLSTDTQWLQEARHRLASAHHQLRDRIVSL